ncbi:MAG: hypothetical protein R3300_17505 [Candidatus Promineifilaceae bacterium]|nr:hypothetical protein [Candidatus Promineifilaceae bacterium]
MAVPDAVISLVGSPDSLVSPSAPLLLRAELTGWDIARVDFVAGVYEAGSRRVLVAVPQHPEYVGADGGWPGGVHELAAVWSGEAAFVTNGEQGGFVLLQAGQDGGVLQAQGSLIQEGVSQETVVLDFDARTGILMDIHEATSGRSVSPSQHNGVRLDGQILDGAARLLPDGRIDFTTSGSLQLGFQHQPLPPGPCFAGFIVTLKDGRKEAAVRDCELIGGAKRDGLQVHVGPESRLQFHYPSDWIVLNAVQDGAVARHPESDMQLSLHSIALSAGITAGRLTEDVLAQFGPLTVLYQDSLPVANVMATWTAYGYLGPNGERTGVLLVLVNGANGYILEFEGPASGQEELLTVVEQVVETITFRPGHSGGDLGMWSSLTVDGLSLAAPSAYRYRQLGPDRHQLGDLRSGALLAFGRVKQVEPAMVQQLELGREVGNDFRRSVAYEFVFDGATWQRIDFTYRRSGGAQVVGSLVGRQTPDGGIVVWWEAPEPRYVTLEREVFKPLALSIHLKAAD